MKKTELIPVGILGATGMVGQKFIELLQNHPWFKISELCGSERSANKTYGEVVNWQMDQLLSEKIANMLVKPCHPTLSCRIVFSGLDSSVAGHIEENFARHGYIVISNSKNHRMKEDVPLLIPEINSEHLDILKHQTFEKNGKIITNPNCSVIGLAMALKPLEDHFGIRSVDVVTLQAISGAGYPGVASLDIIDNVIPHIEGEEEKIESEPLKIFGKYQANTLIPHPMTISAQCNRIPTIHGHLECITVQLRKETTQEEIIEVWNQFNPLREYALPTSPIKPIHYLHNERYPQPRKHRHLENGMQVSIGRLRKSSFNRWKFVLVSHNTIRGAAGGAILNAELMLKKKLI